MKKIFLTTLLLLFAAVGFCAKQPVWIISDGNDNTLQKEDGRHLTDPDDVSAIASYLLMSNNFDTKGIVVASNHHAKYLSEAPNQASWARAYFGAAYAKDLPNLNREIGGYQEEIPFYESFLKNRFEKFDSAKKYTSLKEYSSIAELVKVVKKSKEVVNIMCWGSLTEPAIFVAYCLDSDNQELLSKVRFISHWTSSYFYVGTKEEPHKVHNCFNDSAACAFMKEKALGGIIKFYECGAIGQSGVVEGGNRGEAYYNQFKPSYLGQIYAEGKFVSYKQYVDGSDAATYWALLGDWGVSLSDINSNGVNTPEIEAQNEQAFYDNSKNMQNELLRRARVAAGAVASPVKIANILPGYGLTDPHVWIENGKLYLFGGHDQSWLTNDTWKMDRWDIFSTSNLLDWQKEGEILPTDTYIGDQPNCWAGDIVERDGKYYWYFSNRSKNTGVVVSDSITGGFKDPLAKPLLPTGIVGSIHPYDPEIFVEDGKYYIIFGAGTYHISELADDMISLKTKPEPILIQDENGKRVGTQDKSSAFYRNGIYYLVWGFQYATADNIKGPYKYRGKFLQGGHTSIFEWQNQWYVVQENKDLSLFFRGVSLKPIYFDRDGLIIVSHDDIDYPGKGRTYHFTQNEMGWRATKGTVLEYDSRAKMIKGKISGESSIESCTWLLNPTEELSEVKFTLKNLSNAAKAKVYLTSYEAKGMFWSNFENNWDEAWSSEVALKPSSEGFVEYSVKIDAAALKPNLKTIRIDPAVGATSGEWQISDISIE